MSEATSADAAPVDTKHGDDLDVRAIVVWGTVSVTISLVAILLLHAMYNMFADEQRVEKSYNATYAVAASALDRQNGALQQPLRWLDQEGNTVGVPIDKAMELTLQDYEQTN